MCVCVCVCVRVCVRARVCVPVCLSLSRSLTLAASPSAQRAVELRLQESLLRAFELEPKVLGLNAARSQLEVVGQDCEELLLTITAAAGVAEGVSAKVREIDLARSRLQQVAERVEKIASSKQAAEELEMALDHEQYEEAAAIVRRYVGAFGPPHLVEGIQGFAKAVDDKLSDAEALGDVQAIGRFAQLGAVLGGERKALGIKRFAKHLRGVVAKTAKTHREELAGKDGKGEVGAHLGCFSAILQVRHGCCLPSHITSQIANVSACRWLGAWRASRSRPCWSTLERQGWPCCSTSCSSSATPRQPQ